MAQKFPSKASYGMLIFVFLIFFGPLVPAILSSNLNGEIIGTLAFLSLLYAFIVHLFLNTVYIIDGRYLKIKCGVFKYKPIDIEGIKSVTKTSSIISSPAPSFDRIEIKYSTYEEIIISPQDKIEFTAALTKINPNIKVYLSKK
jgi:hypothetical protein